MNMAFGSGRKPAKQGSSGTPKVQPAKVSKHTGSKSANNTTPTTAQTHRGYRPDGVGGRSPKQKPRGF
jgi:hypothetical protein